MRLFAGIPLADEATQALQEFVDGLRRDFPHLRWSLPQQWHVTLQFLGETNEDGYACVVHQLRTIQAHAVEIRLTDPGFFERAGIFHIAIKPTDTLLALHRQVEQALKPCEFEPESRQYSPHITLARNKGRALSIDFKQLQKNVLKQPVSELPEFIAREFLLYQSFTQPSGSRYEVRERFPLM